MVRKAWITEAFRHRRRALPPGSAWPADSMKPDVHREFLPVSEYLGRQTAEREALRTALIATHDKALAFARWCSADSRLSVERLLEGVDVETVLDDVDMAANDELASRGLAEALAEIGLFPMFGMPTRVRNLYTRLTYVPGMEQVEAQAIDRDLEVAIQEFAPGHELIQDKRVHRAIGFSGDLLNAG